MTPWLVLLVALALGLLVGSFLNVVISRLPRMLARQWREESLAFLASDPSPLAGPGEAEDRLNLSQPASHCPQCRHPIRWRDNLPLLSFGALRGRCRHCDHAISWRYPLVEALTGAWFACAALVWGGNITAFCWALWGAALIALAFIDAEHQLLPDNLTLPLCWLGLLASTLGWIAVDPVSAVWGAAVGYLLLWGVAQAYERLRGQVGMGQGDFKLLAALGAWLGWQNLSLLLLLACALGIAHGLLRPREQRQASAHFAFGPSLCLAALVVVLWGRGQPVLLAF
jgi:leader peptidase (prepilin peptidase) / N-methyltransferase